MEMITGLYYSCPSDINATDNFFTDIIFHARVLSVKVMFVIIITNKIRGQE